MGILYYEIDDTRKADEAKLYLALHNYHADLEPGRFKRCSDVAPVPSGYFGIICYDNEEPIGFANGYLSSQSALRTTQVALLENLYVAVPYRRQGVGAELLRRFENTARIKGAHTLRIGVVSANKEAIRFYARHLYQQVELKLERGI